MPGKSHGHRSLVGYSPWGRKESDMTERLYFREEKKKKIKPKLIGVVKKIANLEENEWRKLKVLLG